ncbi:hypothetical protein JM18_008181 [Phytophthora kernoviae]|uniref:Myb-like domain-containing protein n=2 Tax=Phytophthora kernoviae TaxID=325452 RepID=A0A8T0LN17_9STRA|nr:hypothetical protein G195_009762 [Phytophthora kernoviae 00238/432]KAG2511608.1 hypothetical protein JM16_008219 [Phytophthora kernoviae]KAG2515360.1 hypothetical protein JM18_008181 [Phytophthora kernoviae]
MATSAPGPAHDAPAEPEELQGEPRWSSIRYAPHPQPAQWSRATDEKLMLLVTQSTASGERFPVGVNWLEVSRVVRRSPMDCVKRYAFLHDAREQYNAMEGKQLVEVKTEGGETTQELEGALLDSEDDYLEDQTSLSNFSTPVASPKLQALDTSREFDHVGEMGTDPNYSASILTHAFKGVSRKISNSEYPFLKEEDMSARQSAASSANSSFRATAAPFLNDAYGSTYAAAGDLQRQMNAHLMRMSTMSTMSSFHGDNPFTGSVTQSALEDAFLDMAGSRLDASSVLLGSRMSVSGTQSQLRAEHTQAPKQAREERQSAQNPDLRE